MLDQKRIGLGGEIGRVYKLFLEAEEQLGEADQLFTVANFWPHNVACFQ